MVFSWQLALVFAVTLAVSAIGFRYYIWFFSVGYGFSVCAVGMLLLALFRDADVVPLILCLLLIIYGARLGGYLFLRERKIKGYNDRVKDEIKDSKSVPIGGKIAIWMSCAILYVLQTSPIFFRLLSGTGTDAWCVAGAVVMVAGFTLEMLADIQKQSAKKKNPSRFCDTGLYRFVRCPNYLGEMLFWAGALISGIGSVTGWQWLLVALGFILISYVMFSGARRIETRQNKSYSNDQEYQKYVKTVPILLPFVPLYTLEKYTFLVA